MQARRPAGFSLIEALVALAVAALALMGLVGMQLTLSRQADAARQRSEALRLAEARVEALRAFTGLHLGAAPWSGLVSGADEISGYSDGGKPLGVANTTYARVWTLGGTAADAHRPLAVAVHWVDRAGDAQVVELASVVAQASPGAAGAVLQPSSPGLPALRWPGGQHPALPPEAQPLDAGHSAIQFGGFTMVLNDADGRVEQRCAAGVDGNAACVAYPGHLLAGAVSGAVDAAFPAGINVQGVTGYDTSRPITCRYTTGPAGHHSYVCVIPVAVGHASWSGAVRLGGVSTAGMFQVCRIQQAASAFATPNQRHVQPYVEVGTSLRNQHYVVAQAAAGEANACPVLGAGAVAVLHQDCRSSQSPSTAAGGSCPAAAYNAPVSASTP